MGDRPYAWARDDGTIHAHPAGVDFVVKAGERGTGNGAAFMEYVTGKGEEPPDHVHDTEDELFYVVDGELTFRCGGESFDVGPGGFVFLPKGVPHGYTIRSDDRVRLLIVTAPPRPGAEDGWGGFIGGMERRASGS